MDYKLDSFRTDEYPVLKGETYLDHGGSTLPARSLLEAFRDDMTRHLYGNPHSESTSSELTTQRIEEIRLRCLEFFNADPNHFDLVFVQNATTASKLVVDILNHCGRLHREDCDSKAQKSSFWYGYHIECHTSLVGLRELAEAGHVCFQDDKAVEAWINTGRVHNSQGKAPQPFETGLFAYPGQSNLNGRRLPLSWPGMLRHSNLAVHSNVYSLLDAAALASTAEVDLRDSLLAPDFTAVSFYKIFGFPDLGGLIVRRDLSPLLRQRRYFGGGTVEMVVNTGEPWHSMRIGSPHEYLEDGTPPFHMIIALGHALNVHQRLYMSQASVSVHTTLLAKELFERLSALRHANGQPICTIYKDPSATYGDSKTQGATIAFNIADMDGRWVRLSEVAKTANQHHIHLRTGDVCNPGGVAKSLALAPWEQFRNYAAGLRCGCKNIVIGNKPSGVIRISLGPMSNAEDVDGFVSFVHSNFRDISTRNHPTHAPRTRLYINTVMIYPIDGCCGWRVGHGIVWGLGRSGLRWDRQWCLIDMNENIVLTQDEVPRLALIRTDIDEVAQILKIGLHRSMWKLGEEGVELQVPLHQCSDVAHPLTLGKGSGLETRQVKYFDEKTEVNAYTSENIVAFFSNALHIRCTLARLRPLVLSDPLSPGLPVEAGGMMRIHDPPQPLACQEHLKSLGNPPQLKSHEFKREGDSAKDLLRMPQEVLAESMKANLVLAELPVILHPRLDESWNFVNISRRYVEVQRGSGPQAFHFARVTTDTLPRENLRLQYPTCTDDLHKLVWSSSPTTSETGEIGIQLGQAVDVELV